MYRLMWKIMICRICRECCGKSWRYWKGASTGGGTSYTAQETMNLKDHIACLQEAITVKKMEEGDFSGLAAADDGVREVRFDHTITRF